MIVVAGGTGRLGQRLVPRLVERGVPVRVFTRDASRARGLAQGEFEVFVGDVRDRDRVAERFKTQLRSSPPFMDSSGPEA